MVVANQEPDRSFPIHRGQMLTHSLAAQAIVRKSRPLLVMPRRANSARFLRDARGALLIGLAYYLTARLSLEVALVDQNVTPIWPPAGIAIVAMLRYGRRIWPAIALAAFAVNASISPGLLTAAAIALGNTLAPGMGAWLLRKVDFRSELDRTRDAVALVGLGALASTVISATVGTTSLVASGAVPVGAFAATWLVRWMGDAMGVLVFAPILLLLARQVPRGGSGPSWRWRFEVLAIFVLLCLACVVGFWTPLRLEYLVFPLLAWIAWHFGQRGAAPALLFVSCNAVWAAVAGSGPFANGDLLERMVTLQVFTATATLTSLVLAALLTGRNDAIAAILRVGSELEERVRERTEELVEVQQIAHLGSWQWDISADVVTWSDELRRIFGVPSSEQMSYETYMERVHPKDRTRARGIVEAAYTGGAPFSFDHRIVRPDGAVRILHGRGRVVLDEGGVPIRMVGTAQDITERREAEEQRDRVQEEIRLALAREQEIAVQLRRASEMKDTFLRTVSHDLRTPLSVIVWLAQALGQDGLDLSDTEPRELLRRIEKHAQGLDRLVVDLLDLDRLSQGGAELVREPADLGALVQRMVERSDLADERPVRVEAEAVLASIDSPKVERIVENLLANLGRHTPAGSPVSISVSAESGGAAIVVEDSGPGVPDEFREAIFEPFQRGIPGRGSQGVGVGLSLVRQLARLHGGNAWVEDGPGGGASFRVWLPAAAAAEHASSGTPTY
jgi:PAS domain S-box-containing protein